jgi:glucose dehydrogenase
MVFELRRLAYCAALTLAAAVAASPGAFALDPARIADADKTPADWLTYHGSSKSYPYSGLDQINADNVKNLEVAFIHLPGRSTRGLQTMPLAADGVL